MTASCRRKPTMAMFARFIFSLILIHHHQVKSEPTHDKKLLLNFINNVTHDPNKVNWVEDNKSNRSVCDWTGVICDLTNSSVRHLRLSGKSLIGEIPNNTIGNLSHLVFLSLRHNKLNGSIPSDFSNLKYLQQFVLHNNSFTGQLPNIYSKSLNMFDVSNNDLEGCIPCSLFTYTFINDSSFSGNTKFKVSNFSGNTKFKVSNFSGNTTFIKSNISFPICNQTIYPCPVVEKKPKTMLSTGAIVGISVGSPLMILILSSCLPKKRKDELTPNSHVNNNQTKIIPPVAGSRKDELTTSASTESNINKFVFFDGGIFSFGLEDLLRPSAEVLGKGSVGTTYKTLLNKGTTVVVKRLKDVVVTKKEFDLQMEDLGKLKNENVVPLQAYYFSKDKKLLVYDYLPGGSLYALLHGSRGSGRTPLDWDHRMRIAMSAARGVAYLHEVGKIVHGNIKSSNILLGQETNKDVFVSDYGLNTLFGMSSSVNHSATFKSDVYSFGVLLLELLTGKAPNQASLGEEGIDLPKWVQSVPEVFDVELTRFQNTEKEMVQLLKIAKTCVSIEQDQRPTMQEVVRMMENMNKVEVVEIIAE